MIPRYLGRFVLFAACALGAAGAVAQDAGDSLNMHRLGKWGYGNCWDVAVVGNLVAVGSGSVLEVGTLHPTTGDLSIAGHVTLPSPIYGLAIVGTLVYVADNDAGLRIVDITDTRRPVEVGACWLPDDAMDVAVSGNYAYVAADRDGLRVVDVSDPTSPFETGFVDTDGYATKVAVKSGYAYVADGYSGSPAYGHLRVIDVGDPAAPFEAANYEFTQSSYVYAWGVALYGSLCYVSYEHGYITTLDITDPTNPVLVGGFDQALDTIYDVTVQDGHLYAAYAWRGLGVFSLADPAFPAPVAVIDTPENGWRVTVTGDQAFVADREGGLQIFDVSDPTVPVLDQSHYRASCAIKVAIGGDHHAFVADEYFGLRILDLANRLYPREIAALELPGNPVSLVVQGDLVYVTAASAGLRIVDVSDPAAPVEVGFYVTEDSAEGIAVDGDHVYVTEYNGDLLVFDVSDPTVPVIVGGFNSNFLTRNLCVDDGVLYCANRHSISDLRIYDVSDPTVVSPLTTVDTPGMAWDCEVQGDYLYVTAGYEGLLVLDVTNPASPSLEAQLDPSDGANGLCVQGDFVYVAGGGRVWMADVSDPTVPAWAGYYDVGGTAWECAIFDGDVCVADFDDGLLILRNELLVATEVGSEFPPSALSVAGRPNPFNPRTVIEFAVPAAGPVQLAVYDIRGRLIMELLDAELPAGPGSVIWDGRDRWGRAVASGVYHARLVTGSAIKTGKLVLAR